MHLPGRSERNRIHIHVSVVKNKCYKSHFFQDRNIKQFDKHYRMLTDESSSHHERCKYVLCIYIESTMKPMHF